LGEFGVPPADSLASTGQEGIRQRVRAFHVVEGGSGSPVYRHDGGKQLRR
jgi:hypothetical protein